jgi:hypothetical protein
MTLRHRIALGNTGNPELEDSLVFGKRVCWREALFAGGGWEAWLDGPVFQGSHGG